MSGGWAGSRRRTRLPGNWRTIRAAVLRRDGHQCTWVHNGQRCIQQATEVDHIRPMTDDHSLASLRSLCTMHHSKKSSAEGHAVRWAIREARPAEKHPGVIS
jgi:5-methylcytosine-specific restriction enzyme A